MYDIKNKVLRITYRHAEQKQIVRRYTDWHHSKIVNLTIKAKEYKILKITKKKNKKKWLDKIESFFYVLTNSLLIILISSTGG